MIHYLQCSAPEVLKSGGFRIKKRSQDEEKAEIGRESLGVVTVLKG